MQTVEKFSNATFFRQIALQNLQRKNLRFSETELECDFGLYPLFKFDGFDVLFWPQTLNDVLQMELAVRILML